MLRILTICLLLSLNVTYAEKIYTWIDDQGVVHYGTKPAKGEDVQKAKLPEINKTKHSVPKSLTLSCAGHQGIDCSRGKDTDGSVICTDGFRDSASRFIFRCNDTKLRLENISSLDQESGNFSVFIRNKGNVTAKGIEVNYQIEEQSLKLAGPEKLKAYEIGEYLLEGLYFIDQSLPKKMQVEINCTNCK